MTDKMLESLNFLEQGELIHQTMEGAPEDFPTLLKDMKIGKRKAYYLAAVARAFEGIPAPRDQLLRIGWTKLQLAHEYVDSKNWKPLLAKAEELPVYRLKEYLQTGKVEDPKNCVLLYFTDEEFEIFKKAIGPHIVKGSTREKETALIAALGGAKASNGSLMLKPSPET